jgi:hypothetical protein
MRVEAPVYCSPCSSMCCRRSLMVSCPARVPPRRVFGYCCEANSRSAMHAMHSEFDVLMETYSSSCVSMEASQSSQPGPGCCTAYRWKTYKGPICKLCRPQSFLDDGQLQLQIQHCLAIQLVLAQHIDAVVVVLASCLEAAADIHACCRHARRA